MATKTEPSGGMRIAHLVFAIIGTIVLTAATWWSTLLGASATTNDPCGSGDDDGCLYVDVLLVPPLVIWMLALILTWVRSRKYSTYVPHGWAPFVGLVLIIGAWVIAYLSPPAP